MENLTPLFERSLEAARQLNLLDNESINQTLLAVADATERGSELILAANALDLAQMDLDNPMYDRLLLTKERIRAIADDIRNVATLPSPLGQVLSESERPNGLVIRKVSVPFGVIGVIYEARPNVGFDVFSLCLKSGNACVLKGGSDARHSNSVIVELIRTVLREQGLPEDAATLLPAERQATAQLLTARGYVDLLIPRGSRSLIDYVRENACIPVIETGAGICHTYVDKAADLDKAAAIVCNAKTRRVSVCNALDCMIIHRDRTADLPMLCQRMISCGVIIYADAAAFAALRGHYPEELLRQATDGSFGTEFLSYAMSIRTVSSLAEALQHIIRYSSKHSEAIVSEDPATVSTFLRAVDAACVYANVSTAFTDGAQFGLGAEIGISTQKLHARGPMALHELTSYKYLIVGSGQTRN